MAKFPYGEEISLQVKALLLVSLKWICLSRTEQVGLLRDQCECVANRMTFVHIERV